MKKSLVHTDARINPCVKQIRNQIDPDKQEGAQDHQRFQHLEIRIVQGVDPFIAEPGNTEKRLQKQTAGKKKRQDGRSAGNDRDHRIFQQMFEVDCERRSSLCDGGA